MAASGFGALSETCRGNALAAAGETAERREASITAEKEALPAERWSSGNAGSKRAHWQGHRRVQGLGMVPSKVLPRKPAMDSRWIPIPAPEGGSYGCFAPLPLGTVISVHFSGLPPIVVPKRELVNADYRHENLCYCLAVS